MFETLDAGAVRRGRTPGGGPDDLYWRSYRDRYGSVWRSNRHGESRFDQRRHREKSSIATGGTGEFRFPLLRPGIYTLAVIVDSGGAILGR